MDKKERPPQLLINARTNGPPLQAQYHNRESRAASSPNTTSLLTTNSTNSSID